MDKFFIKIKQLFFTGLLKIIKALKILKNPIKLLSSLFFKPFSLFFGFLIRFLILPLYQDLRKIKKTILAVPLFLKNKGQGYFWRYGPLAMLTIIGLIIFTSNLKAQEIKPDNFGQKSLMYQIVQTGETFSLSLDEDIIEETEEGPMNSQQAPSSYLQDEALTADDIEPQKASQDIDTLISVTNDESALISPEITDPEIVTKKRDKIIDYKVQTGDTLSTIAAKFNLKTTTILWENNLSYYSLIKPGQTLKILPTDGLTYKIKSGDNLSKIAKKYEIDAGKIIEFNKLASAIDIEVGQTIIMPGAVKKETYVPAQPYSIKNVFSPVAPSASKLQWPTNAYRITQYYNWQHHGLDIGNKTGQPIYAAEAGVVIRAGWNNSGYGYMVQIDHGGGLETIYAHASKIYVKVGDKVNRGQAIAAIGSTGRSTGPHLHFEVRVNNGRLNPLGYIR